MPKNRRRQRRTQHKRGIRLKLKLSIVRDSVPGQTHAEARPDRPDRRWWSMLSGAIGALLKTIAFAKLVLEWLVPTIRNQFYPATDGCVGTAAS